MSNNKKYGEKKKIIGERKKMFTKQHFEKIAKLLKNSESKTKQDFILDLVKLFACDNSKFDQSRFLKASGLNQLNLSASGNNKTVKSVPKQVYFKFTPLGCELSK